MPLLFHVNDDKEVIELKGFSPSFNQENIEINSKSSNSFIELGVANTNVHSENCECEECSSLRGGEQNE